MNIKITKQHLEEMKKQLNERMYRIQKTFREDEEYNMACWTEDERICTVSDMEVLRELDRTYRLCDDIDWYIENLRDDEIEVNSDAWFEEWDFKSTVDDNQFDEYYMLPIEQAENIRRNKMKYNKTIRIYRTDVEKIQSLLDLRLGALEDLYEDYENLETEFYNGLEDGEELSEEQLDELAGAETVAYEYEETVNLYNKAEALLADESFDFIYVDADEWYEQWYIEGSIDDGFVDMYYMLPNSDEADEMMERERKKHGHKVAFVRDSKEVA